MAKTDNLTDFLTDVANAIRTKKGTTDKINPQDFSAEITNLPSSGGSDKFAQLVDRTITEVTADDLKGISSIGNSAFNGCRNLTDIAIPDSVTSIGSSAFSYCSGLTSITIPDSVMSIGAGAFQECSSLTSVTIPDSVTNIRDYTFTFCSGLTSVTIGNGVTSIGNSVFQKVSGDNLTITLNPTTPPTLGTNAFSKSYLTAIYVPAASLEAYKTATNWAAYADKMVGI